MGSKFAICDYLFGTLVLSSSTTSRINFGIPKEELNYTSFLGNLLNPFRKLANKISKHIRINKN